jgi:hypothetical protein
LMLGPLPTSLPQPVPPLYPSSACLTRSPPHLIQPLYLLTILFHQPYSQLNPILSVVPFYLHAAKESNSDALKHREIFSLFWLPMLLGPLYPHFNPGATHHKYL